MPRWFASFYLTLIAGVLSVAQPASADLLLVVAHSQSMFGDAKTSLAFEKLGAGLVESKLGQGYRRIFRWHGGEEAQIPFRHLWNEILSARQPDEPLDVFVMEHGSMGILSYDGFVAREEVPFGMIRRYYTTGCQNWGEFTSSVDMEDVSFKRWIWKKGYGLSNSRQLETLGVREYIMHANNNSTGLLSLPLIADQLSKTDSWIEGFRLAMDRVDDLTALWVPSLFEIARAFAALDPDMPEDGSTEIHEWIRSRPVFGGLDLPKHLGRFGTRAIQTRGNEILVRPTPILARFLDQHCPEAFSGKDDCQLWKDHALEKASPVKAIQDSFGLLQILATVMSPNGDGCLSPNLFQDLVTAQLSTEDGTSPILTRLCFKRVRWNEFRLEWEFSDAKKSRAWNLKKRGELRIRIQAGKAKLRLKGVKVGKYRVRALHLRDDGRYSARVNTTFLRIPISLNGNYEREGPFKLRILGFLGFKALF